MEYLIGGLILIFGLLIGMTVGIFIGMERMRKAVENYSIGNLRIDRSEPDEPAKPYLESDITVESISQRKFVVLKVINENYLDRE